MFFFLVQSEQGDIFKVTLETDDDMVSCLKFSTNKENVYYGYIIILQ